MISLSHTIRTSILLVTILIGVSIQTIIPMAPQGPFGSPPGLQRPAIPGGAPQFGPPPGGSPFGGPIEMPSEEEFEAMLKEIQKLETENPGMLKELELAGHRAILEMPEAELQMFSQLVNMTPEALREEASKALTEAGIIESPILPEYPTEEPRLPEKPSDRTEPKQKPEQPKSEPSKKDIKNIQTIFDETITSLEALQQKSAAVREVHTMVRNWLQELREILFYTRVLNNRDYYQDLAQAEFQPLINTLSELNNTIKSSLSLIVLPDDLSRETTAFDLLAIPLDATQQQIDKAFEKLEKENNPKKLEEKLRKEGAEEKSIQRQLKTARLNFEIIEDAYDQLSDPKMHEQLVRGIKGEKENIKQSLKQAQKSLNAIQDALEKSVYEKGLLEKFEQFLGKYAPKQLAIKREMEEAEKKHLEDQKKRNSTNPPGMPNRGFEPEFVYPPRHNYNDHGYYSDYSPYSPWYNDYNPYDPGFGYEDEPEFNEPEKPAQPEKGVQEKEEKKEEKDKKDKDKDKDQKNKPTEAETKAAEKTDPRSVEDIAAAIEKNLNASTQAASGNTPEHTQNQQIINNFKHYLTSKVKAPASQTQQKQPDQTEPKQKNGDKTPWKMTPEERAGWESLPGVNEYEPVQQKPGETKKSEDSSGEMIPAPANPAYNRSLKELLSNLKVDVLLKDSESLAKKIKLLHITPSDKLRDTWVKVGEAQEANREALKKVTQQLTEIKKSLPADKAQMHGNTLDEIINNIADVDKKITAVKI